ncbi:chemotaxis protein CheW [Lichenifustis flavocetrariae]|uniref:Chemotaxis protein CheW n=1 Tax=Lichenifustis flavocetrariae TaxID=2949735 RepID=A0AA41Z102_9HYPH|nr:chemotaxis protein CheW [Lichenifustis flavocetrariae]MCW6512209.1 chemotaxis protein CheW [Lichenifustis flavocetrariae]
MTSNASKETEHRELITFRFDAQEFCVDVMVVREIRVWTPATPVAHAPDFICGVINLRGSVLPIIDFGARLGLQLTTPSSRHAILVVEIGSQIVGLLVEGVSEILTVPPNLIQPLPDVALQSAKDFVSGIVAVEVRMISLIALEAILPPLAEAA